MDRVLDCIEFIGKYVINQFGYPELPVVSNRRMLEKVKEADAIIASLDGAKIAKVNEANLES